MPNTPEIHASANRLRRRPLRNLNQWRDGLQLSFEYFPPRTPDGKTTLLETAGMLDRFNPAFNSVTFGAGGNVETESFATIDTLIRQGTTPVMAHLAWLNYDRDEIDALAERLATLGVHRILALRGDPLSVPGDQENVSSYSSTPDFIRGLKRIYDFDISVAGYPETHPEATSSEDDIDWIKRKVDTGANRVICQFCYDSDRFLRFRDRAVSVGISVPLIPGILPIDDFRRISSFAKKCGATIPQNLKDLFTDLPENEDVIHTVSATVAAELCTRLIDNGITHLHFYTLNQSCVVRSILHILGFRESQPSPVSARERIRSGRVA